MLTTPTTLTKNETWRKAVGRAILDIDPEYRKAVERFLSCGEKIVAVHVCTGQPNHQSIPIPDHCDNRVCPSCASHASDELHRRLVEPISTVISKHARPGYAMRHVIFTTKLRPTDCNARQQYRHLKRQIDATLQAVTCPRKRGERKKDWDARWRALKRQHVGYLVADEFGEAGWRLHFHVAWFGPFLSKHLLSREWKRRTGCEITYIRLATGTSAVREVVKYAAKFTVSGKVLSPQIAAAIYHVLRDQHRVRTAGIFRRLPEVETPQVDSHCPECQAELGSQKLGDWLCWVRHHMHQMQLDETLPDFSLGVIQTLAAAGRCSDWAEDIERIWQIIWGPGAPPYADFVPSPP